MEAPPVDSNDMHVDAWYEALAGIGLTFERTVIRDQIGKGADMLLPALMPELDEATRETLSAAHDDIFKMRFRSNVRPFPKARDLLAHAHGLGQEVVLASSASKDDLDIYLDLLQIRDLVAVMTSGDEVENTKPAPEIFSKALQKLQGITPSEAIVVGDTPYDMEAAGKCGIATVALRSGGLPTRSSWRRGRSGSTMMLLLCSPTMKNSPLGQ
ncbi:HAD family hydrolase [Pararhizobium sp. DWP3-4]|uniref:HAD family hydrolase n=1 Tax=Pararhizobium sp. DWP3-4 TaxID=2804565 RepID=UPI003CF67718